MKQSQVIDMKQSQKKLSFRNHTCLNTLVSLYIPLYNLSFFRISLHRSENEKKLKVENDKSDVLVYFLLVNTLHTF